MNGVRKTERARAYGRSWLRVVRVADAGGAASVMIGPVRGPEHLALIRREGYYHVPVSAIAAARAAVTHIAFYEPASRFGTDGVIREYAPVLAVRQVSRRDLPGLSWRGRAGEDAPYYRFDLGPLHFLPQPITNPGRRRVLFRFADLARVRAAASLDDLRRPGTPRPPRGRPDEP